MAQEGRDEAGLFAPGNSLWRTRSSHGAKPKFKTPEALWDACTEYFKWVEDTPMLEAKAFPYQGEVTKAELPKMRAMSVGALCVFLDTPHQTWIEWRKKRADLSAVITRVEAIIYAQKFEGASADLLNANIIARDLGLADKSDHTSSDGTMTPKDTSLAEVARRMAFVLAAGIEESKDDT